MALRVHAHERRELHKAWVDSAPSALEPRGSSAIRLCSNQLIGRRVASLLTFVGLTRVSIGPAIKVMPRGCASSPSSAINAALMFGL